MRRFKKMMLYIVKYAILIVTAMFVLFPILWTFITSIKQEVQIFSIPPVWLPNPVSFQNYIDAFSSGAFVQRFGNSIIVAVCSTFLSMIIGIPAAYGFARHPYKGSNVIFLSSVP